MSARHRIVFDGNDTERRFPRTLSDATGNPYTAGPVESPPEPMHRNDKIVFIGSAVAALVLIGLIAWGYLP
jgi:hypothetical protein